jgi:hypothetical protein
LQLLSIYAIRNLPIKTPGQYLNDIFINHENFKINKLLKEKEALEETVQVILIVMIQMIGMI